MGKFSEYLHLNWVPVMDITPREFTKTASSSFDYQKALLEMRNTDKVVMGGRLVGKSQILRDQIMDRALRLARNEPLLVSLDFGSNEYTYSSHYQFLKGTYIMYNDFTKLPEDHVYIGKAPLKNGPHFNFECHRFNKYSNKWDYRLNDAGLLPEHYAVHKDRPLAQTHGHPPPPWDAAPEGATHCVQNADGRWYWLKNATQDLELFGNCWKYIRNGHWQPCNYNTGKNPNWKNTLQRKENKTMKISDLKFPLFDLTDEEANFLSGNIDFTHGICEQVPDNEFGGNFRSKVVETIGHGKYIYDWVDKNNFFSNCNAYHKSAIRREWVQQLLRKYQNEKISLPEGYIGPAIYKPDNSPVIITKSFSNRQYYRRMTAEEWARYVEGKPQLKKGQLCAVWDIGDDAISFEQFDTFDNSGYFIDIGDNSWDKYRLLTDEEWQLLKGE